MVLQRLEASVVELTDENFVDEVIQSDQLVLVEFWAEWNYSCRELYPTIEALSEEYADAVKFGCLDVDTSWQTAGEYGIKQVPAVLLFHYGDVVARLDGILPRSAYREALDAWQPMDWVI